MILEFFAKLSQGSLCIIQLLLTSGRIPLPTRRLNQRDALLVQDPLFELLRRQIAVCHLLEIVQRRVEIASVTQSVEKPLRGFLSRQTGRENTKGNAASDRQCHETDTLR